MRKKSKNLHFFVNISKHKIYNNVVVIRFDKLICIWDILETTPNSVCEITVTTTVNPLKSTVKKLVNVSESLDGMFL